MAKKKQASLKEVKKGFPNKKLLMISTLLSAAIISSVLIYYVFLRFSETKFPLRAVIVDQVGVNLPSSFEEMRRFNETATLLLKNAGFEVFYYGSEKVKVSLYQELAKNNYGIIILRTHSAVRMEETLVDFFTSEEFKSSLYSSELNSGLLTIGNYSWIPGKYFFAITPKFIEKIEGQFPGSIVIAMGCSSLKAEYEEMADAFIKKGAKAYIGWTDLVSMAHSDNSTVRFLQYFMADNKTLSEAINLCNQFKDPNPEWGSTKFSCRLKEGKIVDYKLSDFIANLTLSLPQAAYFTGRNRGWLKPAHFLKTLSHYFVEVFPQHVSLTV